MPTEREVSCETPVLSPVGRIALVCSAAIIIGLLCFMAMAVERAETRRHDFLAKCIEFQPLDRCRMLYAYGREDLAEKRQ